MSRRKGVFALLLGVSLSSVAVATTPPPPPPSLTYDARLGTDLVTAAATGLFTFGLRPGCRRVWCDANMADDTGNGLSAATAKKTFMAAITVFKTGTTPGDQIMLAGGSSYTDDGTSGGWGSTPGFSIQYPTAVLCYDRTDAANSTKYGKLFGTAQATILLADTTISTPFCQANGDNTHYFVTQGVRFDGQNRDFQQIGTVFRHDGVCFQNCQFKQVELSISNGSSASGSSQYLNVSKCSFFGMWRALDGNTSGIFLWVGAGLNDANGAWLQDNVFWHCGWKVGSSRDDTTALGAPSVFGHATYLGDNQTGIRMDRCVTIGNAADGIGLRGSVHATQIVSFNEPLVGALSGFSADYTESLLGDNPTLTDFSIAGSIDLSSTAFRSTGIGAKNAKAGTLLSNGVMFDNPTYGSNDGSYVLQVAHTNLAAISETVTADRVRTWNWSTRIQQRSYVTGDVESAIAVTWTNSLVDNLLEYRFGLAGDPTLAPIVSAGVRLWVPGDYPSPKTMAQVISAMGFSGLPAMVNAMVEYPHLSWAPAVLGITFPAFGITPTYATNAVPDISGLPAPTVLYSLALSDLTIGTLNFTRGAASSTLLNGCSAGNFALSSADLPAGFTLAGRTLSYDGTGSGAATPTMHVLETNFDGLGTHTTAFALNISAAGTTWSAATDYTLTNAALTAERTANTNSTYRMLLASAPKTAGTFTVTIDAVGLNHVTIGVEGLTNTTYPGDTPSAGEGYRSVDGTIRAGGGVNATVATYGVGDVIKVVLTATDLKFYKNNALQYTETFAFGSLYPALSVFNATGWRFTIDTSLWV